jgi:hypothetical protein
VANTPKELAIVLQSPMEGITMEPIKEERTATSTEESAEAKNNNALTANPALKKRSSREWNRTSLSRS